MSGVFQTTYWTDDGTKATLGGLPRLTFGDPAAIPSAILVPDASPTGYTKLALTLGPNQDFAGSGVPVGFYFLEVDAISSSVAVCAAPTPVTIANLFELTTSTPDLATVSAARSDVATPQAPPSVSFAVSNMDPWGSRDLLFVASSQARVSLLMLGPLSSPSPGATSFMGTFDWFGGLPDASKHDAVFVYQRATTTIGSGSNAASIARVTKFAKLTDLTVASSSTTSAAVAMAAAPQTGTLRVDLRGSQFAVLAADVNPSAVPNSFSIGVLAVPHSLSYPDMPLIDSSPTFRLSGATAADVDYGTFSYGQFFDPFWKEDRRIVYYFDVASEGTWAYFLSDQPISASPTGPITPVIGPPKAPRVNGANAFTAQTGVGLQPTISWSAPALGNVTSYVVEVVAISPCGLSGQIAGLSALIHSGTSFKVPPGILKPGLAYRAIITARQAPWDVLDAGPFRRGTPLDSAQSLTSTFVP